jgi:fructose-1-phosphate kinase PfkB-like protein
VLLVVTLRPLLARVQFLAAGGQEPQSVIAAHFEAAGPGIAAARALRALGGSAVLLAPGSGEVARCFAARLQDEAVTARLVETAAPMPMCVVHHWWDPQGARHGQSFVEDAARLTGAEMRRVLAEVDTLLPEVRAVVLAGAEVPAGGEFLLAEIAARVAAAGKVVVLATGERTLAEALSRGHGNVVAARWELDSVVRQVGCDAPKLVAGALANGADTVLVAAGADAACLHLRQGSVVLEPPAASDRGGEGVLETVAAGLAVRLAAGWEPVSAACYGLAAGLAQMQKELGGSLSLSEVDGFFSGVRRRR